MIFTSRNLLFEIELLFPWTADHLWVCSIDSGRIQSDWFNFLTTAPPHGWPLHRRRWSQPSTRATDMGFLRLMPEFQLSGSLRGHSPDSSKSVEGNLKGIRALVLFFLDCFGCLCKPPKWQDMGRFFSTAKGTF